jgi:hypothetical protein
MCYEGIKLGGVTVTQGVPFLDRLQVFLHLLAVSYVLSPAKFCRMSSYRRGGSQKNT